LLSRISLETMFASSRLAASRSVPGSYSVFSDGTNENFQSTT